MSAWELLDEKKGELGPWLQRAVWLPLRRLLKMFHILPVVAATIVFVLLASGGQLREIYVSYLEDTGSAAFFSVQGLWVAERFVAVAAGFALISAVLYEAHYLLSTLRMSPIYSTNAELGSSSRLRHVQEMAAIALVLSPWLGLATGLLNAKFALAYQFQILSNALGPHSERRLADMQHVPMPSAWAIIIAVMVLGSVLSLLVAANPKSRTLQRAVIVATPPAATLFFLLLTDKPYFNPDRSQIVFICGVVAAVVAVYYLVYHRLYTIRALVFAPALQHSTGVNLRKYHRWLLFGWALFPWLAVLGLYFRFAPAVENDSPHGWAIIPVAMSWVISIGLFVAFLLHRFRERPQLQMSIYGVVGSLAIVGLLLSCFASAGAIVAVYRAIGPLATLALTLLFMISIFALLALLSQRSGFPVLTLVVLAIVCIVLLPIPIKWTVGTLVILCAFVLLMAAVSRFGAVAGVAFVLAVTAGVNYVKSRGSVAVDLRSDNAPQPPSVQQQFEAWLNHVKKPPAASTAGGNPAPAGQFACPSTATKYPVFIIAVEGGGIYAASAASLLLARLEDANPCFSEHVFAISGVSGGSIGATIFQALDELQIKRASVSNVSNNDVNAASTAHTVASDGCLPARSKGDQANTGDELCTKVSAILQADHFSPVIAAIFPEFLGFARAGRADELAASFEQSVDAQDHEADRELRDPFLGHWSGNSIAPALVLNATWVETGFRAAFAPFALHAIDNSLYSFLDQNMPNDIPGHPLSLMQAAMVSARFPGVLPPYSVLVNNQEQTPAQSNPQSTAQSSFRSAAQSSAQTANRSANNNNQPGTTYWNFVDGGYADLSGATTALALYNALHRTAEQDNADLQLILLTSSDPQSKPSDINGTPFADIMGPIDAILNVRDGMANEAVARACDGIGNTGKGRTGVQTCNNTSQKSPLQIVGIDDKTYGLSLGWKISRTTFAVVSWMLGDPYSCSEQTQPQPAVQAQAPESQTQTGSNSNPTSNGGFKVNEQLVQKNSCVLHNILNLVAGSAR